MAKLFVRERIDNMRPEIWYVTTPRVQRGIHQSFYYQAINLIWVTG